MHSIFISYSTKDTALAETIRDHLENGGLKCWMAPRDIPASSNYAREIPAAIRGCAAFLLLLSDNAQNSPFVRKELDFAVSNNKIILPFLPRSLSLNDEFMFLLSGCQWFSSWLYPDGGLDDLAELLRRLTGSPARQKYVCSICGYVYEAAELPPDFRCPLCKVPGYKFKPLPG